MFLGTPATGVVYDTATLSMDMTALGIKWMINYGTYKQDEGGKDFGDEINAQVLKPSAKKYTLGLKYADYSADKAIATINPVTPNIDTKNYGCGAKWRFKNLQSSKGREFPLSVSVSK